MVCPVLLLVAPHPHTLTRRAAIVRFNVADSRHEMKQKRMPTQYPIHIHVQNMFIATAPPFRSESGSESSI